MNIDFPALTIVASKFLFSVSSQEINHCSHMEMLALTNIVLNDSSSIQKLIGDVFINKKFLKV